MTNFSTLCLDDLASVLGGEGGDANTCSAAMIAGLKGQTPTAASVADCQAKGIKFSTGTVPAKDLPTLPPRGK
jgi:hypothetical protein